MNEYFSHDYRARVDKKLVNLSMKHGMAGVGIFWCIVEMLYEEDGKIERSEYERIAFELRDHPDSIKSVIENFGLFDFDDTFFWSNSVNSRINIRNEKSEKARKSVEKRWKNTNVLQSKNECNTIKEKKSKEKKIKDKFIPPTWEEFLQYCAENKHANIAKRAFDGYSAGNWHDSKGDKIKNWKQKMQHVWFRKENEDQQSQSTKSKTEKLDCGSLQLRIKNNWPGYIDYDYWPDTMDEKRWRVVERLMFDENYRLLNGYRERVINYLEAKDE